MILIKKHPDKSEHIFDFNSDVGTIDLIKAVDLIDLTKYISIIDSQKWVPIYYRVRTNQSISLGEIYWIIFAYLTEKKLLIIEDKYWENGNSNRPKYISKTSFFNPLEKFLYNPILNRLIKSGYIDKDKKNSYLFLVGKRYMRENILNELL